MRLKFPVLKDKTAIPPIQSTILDEPTVVDWFHVTKMFNITFSHQLKYLVYKRACGEELSHETIVKTRVSVFNLLSSWLTNLF